jgi:hypothetical protein
MMRVEKLMTSAKSENNISSVEFSEIDRWYRQVDAEKFYVLDEISRFAIDFVQGA